MRNTYDNEPMEVLKRDFSNQKVEKMVCAYSRTESIQCEIPEHHLTQIPIDSYSSEENKIKLSKESLLALLNNLTSNIENGNDTSSTSGCITEMTKIYILKYFLKNRSYVLS